MYLQKIGDNLIFSRKVSKGAVDDSYGIEVAKLAGINQSIIDVAKNVLKTLEKQIECKRHHRMPKLTRRNNC